MIRRAVVVAAAVAVAGLGAPAGAGAAGELGLTLSGSPAQLIEGDLLTLTARVTNNDPTRTATDLRVNFIPQLDPFRDPPTLLGSGCALIAPPSLSCSAFADLAPGQSTEVRITSTLPGGGSFGIDAGANADVLGGGIGEQLSTATPYPRWTGTVEPKADTKLELTATPTQPRPNDPVSVRAVASNTRAQGVAYATSVRFSIPAGLDVVDKPADCTGTALSLSCPVGDLAPQTSSDRIITVRSATEGSFAILSSVAWARPDTTPIDTQAQVNITVVAPPEDPAPVPKPTVPAKPVDAKPGTLAQGLPLSGRCVRSRRVSFVLRSIRAFDPVRAVIRVTGRKRALVVKGRRALEPISVGLPKRRGRVLLRLQVTYDSGRTYRTSRAFRRC